MENKINSTNTNWWATRDTRNPDKKWWEFYNENCNNRRIYLLSKVFASKPDSILELGCAGACNIQYINEFGNDNLEVVGIDVNGQAIESAKKRFPEYKFYEFDITNGFPLSFNMDVIYSMGVLIHIPNDYIDKVLYEMLKSFNKQIILIEKHSEDEYLLSDHPDKWETTYNFEKRIMDVHSNYITDFDIDIKINKMPMFKDDVDSQNNLLSLIQVSKICE